ncbi:MAG: global cell cycle regulator GcrA-like protein [Alphaproteobacteria bacterium]|nr:global cell cycle regulator GcrA-like protein [Alphaproteobacteria bacterium]
MVWTDDKIKNLKKLWLKGATTAEIAKKLGLSKNSVIGKVHRLNLENRPSPIKKATVVKKVKVVAKKPERIGIMELKLNTCRWPIGDPTDEDFHFCGKNTVMGKPYCAEHCAMAYAGTSKDTTADDE